VEAAGLCPRAINTMSCIVDTWSRWYLHPSVEAFNAMRVFDQLLLYQLAVSVTGRWNCNESARVLLMPILRGEDQSIEGDKNTQFYYLQQGTASKRELS
jgi:hypothetical protein